MFTTLIKWERPRQPWETRMNNYIRQCIDKSIERRKADIIKTLVATIVKHGVDTRI